MIFLLKKWLNSSHRAPVKILNAAALAVLMNLLFGLGFYLAEAGHQEGLTLSDSIWWAMVTMTTVGYGDYYPVTFIGRFFIAYPCFLLGIGFIGFLLGVVVDAVLEQMTRKKKGFAKMHHKNHYIICNCPSKTKIIQIVEELRAAPDSLGLQIVVIDNDIEEQPVCFKEKSIHFIKGEPTSEDAFLRAGLSQAQGVLVLAKKAGSTGSDAETFAIGTVIKMIQNKSSYPEVSQRLVLELVDRRNRSLLEKVEADGIVAGEGISEHLLVQELCNPGLSAIFDQLISYKFGAEFYLTACKLSGKKLKDIQIAAIHQDQNIQVLGLIRDGVSHLSPKNGMQIEESDQLIVLADDYSSYEQLEQSLISSN